MKKLFLGLLAVVMLWGVNVYASEEEGIIDIEVKNKNLSEVVSIVSDINVKENVSGVTYEITNDKAILYIQLEDTSRYEETKDDIFNIDGVESLDVAPPVEDETETTVDNNSNCKCDTISDNDLKSIVTANYILYATLVILLILIVVIIVLIFKSKDTKKKK